ncbi:MAG: type II secretion system minor pseudopilin GspJ [Endozoicomonas sp.]
MRQAGFTLLELMIAILLFSMISLAAYKLFESVSRAQQVSESVLDRLDIMQRAEIILEKDLFQAISRPVRNALGEKQPSLKSPVDAGILIEFTRAGWRNPLWEIRSDLQRVAYAREGDELVRYYWPMLDRTPETPQVRQTVMFGVKGVRFRFLDEKKKWVNAWPPPGKASQKKGTEGGQETSMPAAVEVTIQHEQYGSMVTVVPMITYRAGQKEQKRIQGEPGDEGNRQQQSSLTGGRI